MHYQKSNTTKVRVGSFYIDERLLEKIQLMANFENTSESIIVEMGILNEEYKNYELCKKKCLKKNQKNFLLKEKKLKAINQRCKNGKDE